VGISPIAVAPKFEYAPASGAQAASAVRAMILKYIISLFSIANLPFFNTAIIISPEYVLLRRKIAVSIPVPSSHHLLFCGNICPAVCKLNCPASVNNTQSDSMIISLYHQRSLWFQMVLDFFCSTATLLFDNSKGNSLSDATPS
jgi:hypothetical protein